MNHCKYCNIQRAFFCPGKNAIFFFDTGAVHATAGPYLNMNKEDDFLLKKQIKTELNQSLVELLEAHLWNGMYYLIDLGLDIYDINTFFGEVL
ncbi:Zinc_finger domain-containing protein [Hexamita inflata]|uniref:Zinc_finger domain-containing protein n=1 Tax=Hexamita inflata TaxID=28002 RepID=A0ABP1GJ97_9EUKA